MNPSIIETVNKETDIFDRDSLNTFKMPYLKSIVEARNIVVVGDKRKKASFVESILNQQQGIVADIPVKAPKAPKALKAPKTPKLNKTETGILEAIQAHGKTSILQDCKERLANAVTRLLALKMIKAVAKRDIPKTYSNRGKKYTATVSEVTYILVKTA